MSLSKMESQVPPCADLVPSQMECDSRMIVSASGQSFTRSSLDVGGLESVSEKWFEGAGSRQEKNAPLSMPTEVKRLDAPSGVTGLHLQRVY